MSSEMALVIFVAVIFVALLGVAAFARVTRRAASGPKPAPESEQWVAEAKIKAGERASALVSEEVEELARAKLVVYPDLASTQLDFATAADGSLEIWVDGTQYHSIDEVPDDRLRQAIQAAVQEWNARKGG
jgi:hypothetical protein